MSYKGSFCCVKVTQSCSPLCNPMDYTVHCILQARMLDWVALPFSGDIPNPGTEPRSPTSQPDSLPVEPQRKPKNEWVAYPFSSRSSQPRNLTGVSCIAGGFFTNWAIREATFCYSQSVISILFKFIPLPLIWAHCGSIFLASLPVPLSMRMGQYLSHMVLKFLHLVLSIWPFLDWIKQAPKRTWGVSACCQQMAIGII